MAQLIKEKPFENKVKRFLKSLPHTWFFKVWGGGYQERGLPDIIINCNGQFVALEVKGSGGHPSELQLDKIERIKSANGVAYILYPSGFVPKKYTDDNRVTDYDQIEKELNIIARE